MLCPTTFLSLWVEMIGHCMGVWGFKFDTEEAAPIVGNWIVSEDISSTAMLYCILKLNVSNLPPSIHVRKLDYRVCPLYYLQVLFPVEDDGFCLHLSILDIHLVPTQHDGNVFTNPYQISMPVGNILVSDSSRHVKHDNCTLSLNVVAVSEPPKLLLAGCIPHIEADGPSVCVED